MRIEILVVCLVIGAGAAPAVAQGVLDQKGTAKISGQVTRSDNGKPITNAIAQLLPAGISAVGKRAKVDAQGRFELIDLAAGAYVLNIQAQGYVNLDATPTRLGGAGTAITLKDGEVFAKANVRMSATSSIDGRLLDEFGDPAPGVTVQVAQLIFGAGRTRLNPVSSQSSLVPTDDRGQFHIAGLPAGDYYLLAMSGPFGLAVSSGLAPIQDDRAGFAVTYAPGTPIASQAKPVHLDAGMAANVTFALTPAKLADIAGTVVDVAGHPVGPASVIMLEVQGGDVRAIILSFAQVGTSGAFSYRNVPAGTYVLQSQAPGLFGTALVTVDGTQQTDLQLVLRAPTTARGHILFDGDSPPLGKNGVSVTVRTTDLLTSPMSGARLASHVNDDDSFEVTGLHGIGVMMGDGPPPWQFKSATVDGKDIANAPFDFRATDVNNIEVIFTNHVGSLIGNVTAGDAPACSIIVFPEDRSAWVYPARLVTVSRSDANGAVNSGPLLTGRYLVAAVPLLTGPEIDPADLEALRSLATPVTIDEGKATSVTLKLIKR